MINATPTVNCSRGAPMGRRSFPEIDHTAGKLQLQRVPINRGGYDSGGAYWGLGQPLYCAMDQDGRAQYFRAADRDAAKAKLLAEMPDAKFYR